MRITYRILWVNQRQYKATLIRSFWRCWSLDFISCFFADSSANFFFRSTASAKIRKVESYVAVSVLGRMKPVKSRRPSRAFHSICQRKLTRLLYANKKWQHWSVLNRKNQGLICEQEQVQGHELQGKKKNVFAQHGLFHRLCARAKPAIRD